MQALPGRNKFKFDLNALGSKLAAAAAGGRGDESSSGSGGAGGGRLPRPSDDPSIVCVEFTRGKRRVYRRRTDESTAGGAGPASFEITDDRVTHRHRVSDALASYLLPQGFPDSVAPQYATYMGWRGVQYFFGGAMSVFTTRSLLRALGVANRHAGEGAAAINWVVKDGAGRLGRFLFARWCVHTSMLAACITEMCCVQFEDADDAAGFYTAVLFHFPGAGGAAWTAS